MKFRKPLALLLAAVMLLAVCPLGMASGTGACTHPNKTNEPGNPATCTDEGKSWWICEDCGEGGVITTPALGHSWTSAVIEPTCTENGCTRNICTVCGAIEDQDVTPALGHSMGKWTVVTPATDTQDGTERRICSLCGMKETRPISADAPAREPEEDGKADTSLWDADFARPDFVPCDPMECSVHLSLTLNNSPANGKYFTNGDRTAHISVLFINNNDYPLKDFTLYFPGEGASYRDQLHYDAIPAHGSVAINVEHTVGARIDEITQPGGEGQVAVAVWSDGGFESNKLWLNVDSDTDDTTLVLELDAPELPQRGFFVEGDSVVVTGTLTARQQLHGVDCWEQSAVAENYVSAGELAEGQSFPVSFVMNITGLDCLNGFCPVYGYGYGFDGLDNLHVGYDHLEIPCGIEGVVDPASYQEKLEMDVLVTSTPANGSHYDAGETVTYVFGVYDVGDNAFSGTPGELSQLQPAPESFGSAWSRFCTYVVTPEDVSNGYITLQGSVTYVTSDGVSHTAESPIRTVRCGAVGTSAIDSLVLTETVTNFPANGSCYVEGEYITYHISLYNKTETDIEDILVFDPLFGGKLGYMSLRAGESGGYSETHQVTAEDLKNGVVTTVATAITDTRTYHSNQVSVPVGEGVYSDRDLSISLVVAPSCNPANGLRFNNGELMEYYMVLTNTGKVALKDVVVYDLRDPFFRDPLDNIEPGESRITKFYDLVDSADCEMGWVLNTVYITWTDDLNEIHTAFTNSVASAASYYPVVLRGADYCTRLYGVHRNNCKTHSAVAREADAMVEDGNFAGACAAWTDALNDLYEIWFSAVYGDNLTAARNDKAAFFAMVNAMQKAHNDSEMTLQILEWKCNELCYELYSRTGMATDGLRADCGEYSDRLDRTVNQLPEDADAARMLSLNGQRINAREALKAAYRDLTRGMDEEQAAAVMTACTGWINYMEQHVNTLAQYRSDDYGYLTEVFVVGITDQIARVCNLK